MKTRKLMAVLVMVAMIVTALPVVALGAENDVEAVASASRIYASHEKRDVGDTVTITVHLRGIKDGKSAEATELSSGKALYVWAERVKDEISELDRYETKEAENSTPAQYSEDSLCKFVAFDDVKPLKYENDFAGEVKFWFGIDDKEWEANGGDTPKKTASVTVVFEETKDLTLMVYDPDADEEAKDYVDETVSYDDGKIKANGIDNYEVKFKVVDRHGFPVKGEKVNFSTSSRHLNLSKDSADTDSSGIAKVKATSERADKYTLTAKLASDRDQKVKANLKFYPSAAYNIKVKKGDGVVIALDEPYTFEFEIFDIFDRAVKDISEDENKNAEKIGEYIEKIEVVTSPSKATFKDELFEDAEFKKGTKVIITWTGSLKIKAKKGTLDKEGDYVLRVKLNNGKHATAKFEVKEQGDIVGMTLKYDPAYTSKLVSGQALRLETKMPTIKLVDADGIEAEIDGDNEDLEFSVSNTRIAKIHDNGVVEQRYDDSEGVVVVTVVHTDHNLAATAEVRVGEVGVAGINFLDVPDELLVDEEYTIKMKVLDEDGHEVMKGSDYKVIVLSKPSGAKVELDEDGDKFTIHTDTKGQVKLIATARKDDKAVSGTLTLDFVTERAPVVEGKVFLTIGANFGLVDGVTKELDAPAFIEDGRTFVPVRFLAEAFGAVADYEPKDAAVETVTLTRDDMEIVIGIGDEFLTVTVDDEADVVTFDGAARIVDGRTFLPFRAIAEAFDAEVDYGPKEGLVQWVSFE